ncbi:hypothetical protein [Dyella acidisoli]|uniref:Type IV pilus modification protein PilV n=1 Tax=Dyella acidisoli TaxID=1867834 RepID=A0ABQ5XL60_9GAMM|nr:hypothetical protein [Dyella acidisoli]GLQ91230.1 hypothetical protein GCM10007901_01800 [Dyella acidisoli]
MKSVHKHVRIALTQRGIVLIDALVAIVIFSVGILGMVALQGSAIEMTGSSNYRINAALLTDQVIAQMWATTPSQLATLYQGKQGSGGTSYVTWFTNADCSTKPSVTGCLPGIKTNPPTITVTPETFSDSSNTQYLVTVTLYWQAPSDNSVHQYVSTTAIGP